MAASARACLQQSAEEEVAHLGQRQALRILRVMEQVGLLRVAERDVEMRAAAGAVGKRLRHEAADHAVLAGDLAHRHLHQREVVGRGQRIGIGEVHLELAVRVLVVDLVDVDAGRAQAR